jgi:hypothetical protein
MLRVASFLFPLVALLLAACVAPTEEDIQRSFRKVVNESNACTRSGDCTLVSPGCPLGCYAAVNVESAGTVNQRARDLIEDHESQGRACDYGCPAQAHAECRAGRCEVVEGEPPPESDAGAD